VRAVLDLVAGGFLRREGGRGYAAVASGAIVAGRVSGWFLRRCCSLFEADRCWRQLEEF
jgi:hypothetical protein